MSDGMKFTPGPWVVGDDGGGPYVEPAIAPAVGPFESPITSTANARLIAAAPDLYEACEYALMYVTGNDALTQRLIAAIKKARS